MKKEELIKQLENLKENLSSQTNEQNYCDLVNTLIDYDNENQTNLYDTLREFYEFIDDELLEYLIKDNAEMGLARLRYFINDTYDDDIYLLNAYGNLENVNDDTFSSAIDIIIDNIEDTIK